MPQASDEDRAVMINRFGDIGDEGPRLYLARRGFVLGRDWVLTPPDRVKGPKDLTREEAACIDFLADEWDYGGIRYPDAGRLALAQEDEKK